MVDVNLWSGLRRLAGDQVVVTVQARTVREMLDALVKAHPALDPVIKAGVSVSVNGTISTDLSDEVRPDAEVYLIQRIKGG
jgi:molybdopterin converting factor small subunit